MSIVSLPVMPLSLSIAPVTMICQQCRVVLGPDNRHQVITTTHRDLGRYSSSGSFEAISFTFFCPPSEPRLLNHCISPSCSENRSRSNHSVYLRNDPKMLRLRLSTPWPGRRKVTRTAAVMTEAPPARPAREPNSARNKSELPETVHMSADTGAKRTIRRGRAAPTAKVPAEANAAWTGRAVRVSDMPSSSRACAPSASCAINWVATWEASSASSPRPT